MSFKTEIDFLTSLVRVYANAANKHFTAPVTVRRIFFRIAFVLHRLIALVTARQFSVGTNRMASQMCVQFLADPKAGVADGTDERLLTGVAAHVITQA